MLLQYCLQTATLGGIVSSGRIGQNETLDNFKNRTSWTYCPEPYRAAASKADGTDFFVLLLKSIPPYGGIDVLYGSAPGGIRTHNQQLRRLVLCPLSYRGRQSNCSPRKEGKLQSPLFQSHSSVIRSYPLIHASTRKRSQNRLRWTVEPGAQLI